VLQDLRCGVSPSPAPLRRSASPRTRGEVKESRGAVHAMQFWIIQTLNSVAFGGLLFLLSSGFSLIFGLMRIPNLAHGAFFMLGAYFGYTLLALKFNFWLAAIVAGLGVGLVGIILERFVLRQLPGNAQ